MARVKPTQHKKRVFNIGIHPVGDREYHINGICYVVSSHFSPHKTQTTIKQRVEQILSEGLTPLTDASPPTTMESEYVCSAARKED